jgi:hypothetical protein
MRGLVNCRRGSAAFATAAALVPLIGVVALGAEAGSWYVTKQRAQNAADAAAISGALRLACTLGAIPCADTQTVDYRGKEFAAQNYFCNSGDSTAYPGRRCATSLPTGISQAVQIDIGDYNAGTFTTPAAGNGNAVRATVSQQQPAYLAVVLGLSTVPIPAQAIALVQNPKNVCGLGLGRYSGSGSPTSALEFQGSETMSGGGCGFQSDNTVKYASTPTFNGSGWAVYASQGCVNSGNCNPGVPYNYSMPTATNPLSKLDTESFNTTASGSGNPCTGFHGNNANVDSHNSPCNIAPNTPTTAYGGNLTVSSTGTATFQTGGTFFFKDSSISLSGNVTGTNVNIVLLGNSSISITGGTVNLSANFNNATYPDLDGVLIDDQAPNRANLQVTINGGAGVTIALGGAMYFPNVDVTMSGNSQNANTACTEVIANSIDFSGGTSYLSTSQCASGTVPTTQVVVLVH